MSYRKVYVDLLLSRVDRLAKLVAFSLVVLSGAGIIEFCTGVDGLVGIAIVVVAPFVLYSMALLGRVYSGIVALSKLCEQTEKSLIECREFLNNVKPCEDVSRDECMTHL